MPIINGIWVRPKDYVCKYHLQISSDDLQLLCNTNLSRPKGMKFKYTTEIEKVTCKTCLTILWMNKWKALFYIIAVIVYVNSLNQRFERLNNEV